jgi:HK97 family phage major capsid protein
MTTKELKAQLAQLSTRLHAINDGAEKENRDLTEGERTEWADTEIKVKSLKDRLVRQEQMDTEEREAAVRQPGGRVDARQTPEQTEWSEGVKGFGEFLQATRWSRQDSRLEYEEFQNPEKRDMVMGVGAAGGFLVPSQFRPTLLQATAQTAIVRPRAMVIPAGDPPDSDIDIPVLDQTAALGVFSGVTVAWLGEAGAKPETVPHFANLNLDPNEVAGHIIVSDKLLRNSAAAGAVASTLLRKAINAAEDWDFLRGPGGARPQGIIGHAGTIVAARAVAGTIAYQDIVGMYARGLFGGPMCWIGSPTTLPQLMTLVDAGGHLIWQANAREGAPGTLLGFPVLINQRSPVLGAQGDLMLADFDYYMIKDGSGIFVDSSPHLLYLTNRTVIKAFWNVDGSPWMQTPMLLEDGVTTASPFVVLGV